MPEKLHDLDMDAIDNLRGLDLPGATRAIHLWYRCAVPGLSARCLLFSVLVAVLALVIVRPATARADCNGPSECCITEPSQVTVALPEHIRIAMRTMHISAISESSGQWTGELTVVFRWPAGGLRPDATIRNQASNFAVTIDETTRQGASCYREQRVSANFENWFRLRRFPFDAQELRVIFEERRLTDAQAIWEQALWPNIIAIDAYRELAAWRFQDYPSLEVKRSSFGAGPQSLHPRLLIVSIPVARLSWFYVSRFFIPLFLLVALAYSTFWIKPDDLGSAASIGITCMLSIIAFQLTQADSLPRVGYLTLADRVYVVCYIATAMALGFAIMGSYHATHGQLERAQAMDRRLRFAFPLAFVVAVAVAVTIGWRSHDDRNPDGDIPARLGSVSAPATEATAH